MRYLEIYRKVSGTNQAKGATGVLAEGPILDHPAPDSISCYGMILQAGEGIKNYEKCQILIGRAVRRGGRRVGGRRGVDGEG